MPKMAFDQRGDAVGSPHFRPPAVGLGPLLEQFFELPELIGMEPGRSTGMGLGRESVRGFPVEFQPGVDRRSAGAEIMCDIIGMFTLFESKGPRRKP